MDHSIYFSPREVAFLKNLSEEQAVAISSALPDHLGRMRDSGESASAEGPGLSVFVLWRAVDDASRLVIRRKRDAEVLRLTLEGYTQREIGERVGISQQHAGRLFRATILEICRQLNQAPELVDA